MTITLGWDNPEQTRILWTYGENWSWEDFHQCLDELDHMLHSAQPRLVDIIFDTQQSFPPTKGPLMFSEWSNAISRAPANLNMMVVCNGIPFALSMAKIYGKVIASKGRIMLTAPTVEDARRIIEQRRQS